MAVEEQRLRRLYEAARRTWGDEEAATLMDELGRSRSLATRDDVAAVRADVGRLRDDLGVVRAEVETLRVRLESRMDGLDVELRVQAERLLGILVPTVLGGVSLAFAAGALLG